MEPRALWMVGDCVVKVLAVTSVSIAGVLVSIVALDIKISSSWWQVTVPLYVFAVVASALALLYGVTVVVLGLLLKDALGTLSFFRNRSKNLEASVSRLQDIAYSDPITGIANSHALMREISKENEAAYVSRCFDSPRPPKLRGDQQEVQPLER